MPVLAGPVNLPPLQEASPTPIPPAPSPDDLIAAVNALRISYGIAPLTPHPILMKVAQDQAYVLADSEGAAGHARPSGIGLTDYLLMLGYPLAGDLSQGGYRAENFALGGPDVQDAIQSWLGDELHTNTMLRTEYEDIGAGVSFSTDEWGMTFYYYVIDCAMPTASGRQQSYTPESILTATAFASYADTPQWMIPIALSTARPDGDVIHEVQYGQTLWSLSDQYKVSVEQIKRLNNLTSDTIVPGWTLLIQKGATQPAPFTMTPVVTKDISHVSSTPRQAMTATPVVAHVDEAVNTGQFIRQNSTVVVALVISFSVLVAGIVGFGKKKG